jgi:hypothetical protein
MCIRNSPRGTILPSQEDVAHSSLLSTFVAPATVALNLPVGDAESSLLRIFVASAMLAFHHDRPVCNTNSFFLG